MAVSSMKADCIREFGNGVFGDKFGVFEVVGLCGFTGF